MFLAYEFKYTLVSFNSLLKGVEILPGKRQHNGPIKEFMQGFFNMQRNAM